MASINPQGMRPLKAELVLGERKSRGASMTLAEADRTPGMQQVGLAYRSGFQGKASINVERDADQSVPAALDELDAFEDPSAVVAILAGAVLATLFPAMSMRSAMGMSMLCNM